MAMGFIKKMFSFGKKEVEEKPVEQPAPDAVEAALETELPETAAAPEETQDTAVEVVISEPEMPVIAREPEPMEEPASETVEEEKAKPEHPVAEIEIPIEQPPVMEPIAVEAPAPEPVVETVVEPLVEPGPEPVFEPEQPEVAKTPDAPVVKEAVEPAAQPEVVKPKKVKVARAVEEHKEEAPVEAAPEPKLSWFERLRRGLLRSSNSLSESIGGIFTKRKLDDDTLQDLEDVLGPVAKPLELDLSHKPHVILVVGVNGTGKTTTIGKLAAKLTAGGLKVMLAAGDTFRAAAIEQLHIWGERTGSPVVSSKLGADAAGLAYDAWEKAKEAGSDVLIIDTAGRLQNKAELMDELAKIVRVLGKHDPEAPHTVLQTLDATTGQNALNQVEIFKNIAGVNGLVMTKLDGTARGGILVAISAKHKLPIYFIGVGEGVDDLEPFAAKDFARAIAGVA